MRYAAIVSATRRAMVETPSDASSESAASPPSAVRVLSLETWLPVFPTRACVKGLRAIPPRLYTRPAAPCTVKKSVRAMWYPQYVNASVDVADDCRARS